MPPRKPKEEAVSAGDLLLAITSALRQTARRPSIYGYVPMEHQQQFHRSLAKGRLFMGGNRSGKTVAGGAEAVLWLIGKHPFRETPRPPVFGRVVSVDLLHGVEKIVKPEIMRWMPPSELIENSWEKSYSRELKTLTLANGSTLEFMSMDQDLDKFSGTSRHFVWFDEEPPKEIFGENLARLIDTGGSWWLTMTPVEGMTWVFDDLYTPAISQRSKDLYCVETSMDDNVYLSPNEIEILLSLMPEEEQQARRNGKFVQIGGLIYKMFNQSMILDPIVDGPSWDVIRKHWTHILCMDHGYNNPTAWLWIAVGPDNQMIVYDEHYERGKVVSHHAQVVTMKNAELGINPAYIVGDPSIRNSDPLTASSVQIEYANYGVIIAPGVNDVKIGLNMVARMFETGQLKITRNCEMLIWELLRYRWATWASKRTLHNKNVRDEPNKKDDHACDALRYGVASRYVEDLPAMDVPSRESYNRPRALIEGEMRIDWSLLKVPAQEDCYDEMMGDDW